MSWSVVVLCISVVLAPFAVAPFARTAAGVSIGVSEASDASPGSTEGHGDASMPQFADLGVRQFPLLSSETVSAVGGAVPDRELMQARINELYEGIAAEGAYEAKALDLAGLVMIGWGNGWQGTRATNEVAYELYERATQLWNSCDVQLSFAYVNSLPLKRLLEVDEDLREELHTALTLLENLDSSCADDPTALWLTGNLELDYALNHILTPRLVPIEEDLADAIVPFERLVELYPESPAGYAGLAEVFLRAAESNDSVAMRPFTAKLYWQRAADYYAQATQRTTAVEVALFHAYTLARMGTIQEAEAIMSGLDQAALDSLMERSERARQVAQYVHYSAGDYERAAWLKGIYWRQGAEVGRRWSNDLPSLWIIAQNGAKDTRGLWGLGGKQAGVHPAGGFAVIQRGFLDPAAATPDVLLLNDDELHDRCLKSYTCGDLVSALRHVGQFERAVWVAEVDVEKESTAQSLNNLGIALLDDNRPQEAALQFETAAIYVLEGRPDSWPHTAASLTLRQGHALLQAGDMAGAERVFFAIPEVLLDPRDETLVRWDRHEFDFHWHMQLGELYLRQGQYEKALTQLQSAQDAARVSSFPFIDNGAAANNAALVALDLDRYDLALEQAKKAVSMDPESPIFLSTLADAQRRSNGGASCGELDTAVSTYRKALAVDDSSPVLWNNLGVALAACGITDEASAAFKTSVQINPQYAKGWFNYGALLLVEGSWDNFLVAQGALGVAGSLDGALRNHSPNPVADDEIYDTGLDLSEPLPVDWKLGGHERRSAAPTTLLLIFIVAMRLTAGLLKDASLDKLAVSTMTSLHAKWPHWQLSGLVGVSTSVALLALLSPAEYRERWVVASVATAAVVLPSAVRKALGSRSPETTPPPMLLGAALLAPFGASLPPLPAEASNSTSPGRWRTPTTVTFSVLVAAAITATRFAPIPLGRATLLILIAVLTTTLLPLKSYDGSRLSKSGGRIATVALAAIAMLLALDWV